MTKEELAKKSEIVRKWENKASVILLAELTLLFFMIPFLLKHATESTATKVLAGIVIFVLGIGPGAWFALADVKLRDRLGLRCPFCGRIFDYVTVKKAIETGHCRRCGKSIETRN